MRAVTLQTSLSLSLPLSLSLSSGVFCSLKFVSEHSRARARRFSAFVGAPLVARLYFALYVARARFALAKCLLSRSPASLLPFVLSVSR